MVRFAVFQHRRWSIDKFDMNSLNEQMEKQMIAHFDE